MTAQLRNNITAQIVGQKWRYRMTRAEAIEKIKRWKLEVDDEKDHAEYLEGWFYKDDEIAFDMAIEALKFRDAHETAMKSINQYFDEHHAVLMNWILCDEELPGKGENVLVTNNWHEVRMAYLTDRTRGKVLCWIVDHNSYHPVDRNEILAWMHLPTPFFEPTTQKGETNE